MSDSVKKISAWKMTQEQWRPIGIEQAKKFAPQQPECWYVSQANMVHKREVERALRNGLVVTAEVLADYYEEK